MTLSCVGARSCISPVLISSLDNEVFLVVKKKPFCSFMASKGHSKVGRRVSCKVSENEIEGGGGSSSSKVSFKTKNNNMEDYNTAMKKMMRNPYEYHHDLEEAEKEADFVADAGRSCPGQQVVEEQEERVREEEVVILNPIAKKKGKMSKGSIINHRMKTRYSGLIEVEVSKVMEVGNLLGLDFTGIEQEMSDVIASREAEDLARLEAQEDH